MSWLLVGNYFADALDAQARGTTGYAAIRPKQFLALEISLPPLEEQRRIVGRIEALAARVREALSLREKAAEEAGQLIGKVIQDIFEHPKPGWEQTSLGKITLDVRYGTSEKAFDTTIGLPVLSSQSS